MIGIRLSLIFLFLLAVGSISSLQSNELQIIQNISFDLNNLQAIPQEKLPKPSNLYLAKSKFQDYWKDKTPSKGSGWKQFNRWLDFWEPRLYPSGEMISEKVILDELKNVQRQDEKQSVATQAQGNWNFLGPNFRPKDPSNQAPSGLGRMNCIAIDPKNDQVIWGGAAFGGIWKSTDRGSKWKTFPFTEFLSIGISDIAISNQNSNIVYASTGDADGSFGSNSNYSIGIIKTTDGGDSWTNTGFEAEAHQQVIVYDLIIHPNDDKIVYAASNLGLLKTIDGGTTWTMLLQNIFVQDIDFKSGDPTKIFLSALYNNGQGDYNSIILLTDDGGTIENSDLSVVVAFQYPTVVRIALDAVKDNPNYIYAIAVTGANNGFYALLRSITGGTANTWQIRNNIIDNKIDFLNHNHDGSISTQPAQGHYDLAIIANPNNPEEVHIGGINVWRSVNGGTSFENIGEWRGAYQLPYIHADQHGFEYDSKGVLYIANDGGLYRKSVDGSGWYDISDGLHVTQFYGIGVCETNPNLIMGGTQDNGSHRYFGNNWYNVLGGDGMATAVDRLGVNVYSSLPNGVFFWSNNGGISYNTNSVISQAITNEFASWVAPFAIDPTNNLNVYAGFQNLWKSESSGSQGSWRRLSNFGQQIQNFNSQPLRVIEVSSKNNQIIYCSNFSSTDNQGNQHPGGVYRTTDGGNTWTRIITGGVITSIAIDYDNPLNFWFTSSGFGETQKVMRFDNTTGLIDITYNLSRFPVNDIELNHENGDLYLATDIGVYYKAKTANEWSRYGTGLPNVVTTDIEISYFDSKLKCATFGRGLWDIELLDCDIPKPSIIVDGKVDLCPNESVTLSIEGDYSAIEWSTGKTSRFIVVNTAGDYWVKVSDSKGCSKISDIITVTVNEAYEIQVKKQSASQELCEGSSITLTPNPSFRFERFEWSNGETTKNIDVTEAGVYWVKGWTKANCESKSVDFEVVKYPNPDMPIIEKIDNKLIAPDAFKYQWYLDSQPIASNGTSKEYIATQSGMYSVEVFNVRGCSTLSEEMNVVIASVIDFEYSQKFINVYPNPTEGTVTLELLNSSNSISAVELQSIDGIKLSKFNFANVSKASIDVSQYSEGAYVLVVSTKNGSFSVKIIKK